MNEEVAKNIREKMFEVKKIAHDNKVEYLYLFIVPREREPNLGVEEVIANTPNETKLLVDTFEITFPTFVKAILKNEEDKNQVK